MYTVCFAYGTQQTGCDPTSGDNKRQQWHTEQLNALHTKQHQTSSTVHKIINDYT